MAMTVKPKAKFIYPENHLGALKCLIAAKLSNTEDKYEPQITKENSDLR